MIRMRKKRALVWLSTLVGIGVALAKVEMTDRASGPFQLRSTARVELRAPVGGFLRIVYFDEGEHVSAGALVAEIEIPDLATRQAQKRAELREARARLRLLEVGPRPEALAEQRSRVERAQDWRDLAGNDLERARRVLAEDLAQIDKLLQARQAELDVSREGYKRARTLLIQKAITDEQVQEAAGRMRICQAQLEQTQAERRAREARGVVEAETEHARRERLLADAKASLALLEAGTRPEEIEAERARLARLEEEERYLTQLQGRVLVHSPAAGVMTTIRLREKVGQFLKEGDAIGVIEDPAALEVEVALAEQDARRVQVGQSVGIKARSLPFDRLTARVDRIAPAVVRGESQNTVTVYCHLENPGAVLSPGMTGHARIYTGDRPIGEVALDRLMRFVRTEFWW